MRMIQAILVFIVVFSTALAQTNLDFFASIPCKVDEACNLRIPCTYNDNLCPNDMKCYIDIYNSQGGLLLNYAEMTHNVTNYNHSYTFSTLGTYRAFVQCNNTNINASTSFDVNVVKKDIIFGDIDQNTETRTIIILISLIVIFIALGIYFQLLGSHFKYLFFMLAIVFIDALTYFGYRMLDGINSTFAGVMFKIYWVMLILTLFIFFAMLIDITVRYLTVKKQKEMYAKDYYKN